MFFKDIEKYVLIWLLFFLLYFKWFLTVNDIELSNYSDDLRYLPMEPISSSI